MAIVAAGWNEDAATLGRWASDNGTDWAFGQSDPGLAAQYQVFSQSSKVGIGADGAITLHSGYSRGGDAYWRELLDGLRG